MPDYTPEQLAAVQARNDARAAKMDADLDAIHEKAAEELRPQYDVAKLKAWSSRRMRVSVCIDLDPELNAIREKYGVEKGDIEVRMDVNQDKPEHWWEHVAGPWIRLPTLVTKTVTEAISDAMCVHKWSRDLDELKYDDYSALSFSFECEVKDADALTREFEAQLRLYTIEVLALAEICVQLDQKDNEEDEARCEEHNAYMAKPGAVFEESRWGSGRHSHFYCVVKNPPTGRPEGRWNADDGADQDDVLFKCKDPEEARSWLARHLKEHPEIQAPKDMYEDPLEV